MQLHPTAVVHADPGLLCLPGNDSGGECGVSVANRFSMPGASTEANGGLFTAEMAAFGANGSASPGGEAPGRSTLSMSTTPGHVPAVCARSRWHLLALSLLVFARALGKQM